MIQTQVGEKNYNRHPNEQNQKKDLTSYLVKKIF